MEPKALLKLMYRMYISWFVSLASLSAAISSWICLEVLLSALNPFDYHVIFDIFRHKLIG